MHASIKRFFRYGTVGASTFLLDLALLLILIDFLTLHYLVATGIAFLCAISVNYAISRAWVFPGSERGALHGYAYFIQFALLGAVATVCLMWAVTTFTAWHYWLARAAVAGFVGVWNYFMNLFLNFQVAGKHFD